MNRPKSNPKIPRHRILPGRLGPIVVFPRKLVEAGFAVFFVLRQVATQLSRVVPRIAGRNRFGRCLFPPQEGENGYLCIFVDSMTRLPVWDIVNVYRP